MRILKYIFLLLLLAAIALSVYIGTQNGKFEIERNKIIEAPQPIVYNYVSDFKNWQDWNAWSPNKNSITHEFSEKSKGVGATYDFDSDKTSGTLKTINAIENDSLFQEITLNNGHTNKLIWGFEKNGNITKVSCKVKGELDFKAKLKAFFYGGVENKYGNLFDQFLNSIDTILVKEIKKYAITVDGLARKKGNNYIKQTIVSTFENLDKNREIMFRKLTKFASDNNIKLNGSPYVIFEKYDETNNIVKFSTCIPIEQEIFTSEGSDIEGGKLEPFLAVKTTLMGDYSHSKEAWDKTYKQIAERKWKENLQGKYLEVYKIGKSQTHRVSQWKTEIYVPIVERPKPTPKPVVIDSTTIIN